ncbi:MAG TPA: YggS family pyridoxal phosphate-dependent enzyme [Streptosporangiaceae bacterium]|nr:YggS family pyridoxal phosphate-dependent enzyme [Streptosporangiaceae bacterium]
MTAATTDRRGQLAENLAALRARVAAACASAGRDAGEITVIAVTKTWPASDVRLLAGLGLTDIGENRDSEAAPKAAQCADLALNWHFVGQLQTRKCRSVVGYADVVHSVDRPHLVQVLGREAVAAGRVVTCLVQVGLDGAVGASGVLRGGIPAAQAVPLAGQVAAKEGLRLGGVMAVAPLDMAPRDAFARLADVAAAVRAAYPGATMISAGMSGDLEEAIEAGATHVRVGTALLGARRAIVR